MARVNGPLFSLGASGKLADSLVYMTWKGIQDVRRWLKPANPQTAAQTTQRGYVTSGVSAWKNYFTNSEGRDAWNRWALLAAKTMSGFNGFMSQLLKMIVSDPDCSFTNTMTETAGNTVKFGMLNIDDGATGDEAGNFEIWVGSTASGMTKNEEVAIVAGEVIGTNDLGAAGDIVYCKVRKDSYDRSGIFKATLID